MLRYLFLLIHLIPNQSYHIEEQLCVLDSNLVRQCLAWECKKPETIEACAAIYLHYTCNLSLMQNDSSINECCTNRYCMSRLYQQALDTLKYGRYIPNPAQELSLRRQKGKKNKDKLILALEQIIETVQKQSTISTIMLVQVGAHVGALANDPIYPYLATLNMMHGVLFEPMKTQFEGLTYNYRQALSENRIQLINAAVCEKPGQMSFVHKKPPASEYTASEAGAHGTYDPLFKYMYRDNDSQLGTLGTMVSESDTIDAANNGNEFMESTVTCTTLNEHVKTMLANHPLSPLILIVDAEGADIIVLKDMLQIKQPDLILYEHTHIDIKEALLLMDQYNYACSYYQLVDTLCVKRKRTGQEVVEVEVEVEAMSIDVSKILTGMGINLGFESNAAVEQSSILEIIANGMSIENQVAEYCSLQRVGEFDCDNILLHSLQEKEKRL